MVERLFVLSRGGMKLGLGRVERALAKLGRPELSFPAVHVAGSNGKGSTSAFIAAILAAHGRRVGLYTSPHLVSFTERIRFLEGHLDEEIDPDVLVEMVDIVEEAIPNFTGLSFFEVTTLAALVAFERRGIDVGVIEAGLGARLDATRLVDAEVAVLTDLTLEHTQILGDTIEEIAREEGAVIREERPVVVADGPDGAMRVVDQIAARARAPMHRIGEDMAIVEGAGGLVLELGDRTIEDVHLSLIGPHQHRNALLAARAATLLDPTITDAAIRAGLARAQWPGRMEVIDRDPPVLLDGAHNAQAAQALARALEGDPDRFARPLHFVFGAFTDKDATAMLEALAPYVDSIVFTRPGSPRAREPSALAKLWGGASETTDDVAEALAIATSKAAESGGWVVVCGSLYLVGDVRAMLEAPNLRPFFAQ